MVRGGGERERERTRNGAEVEGICSRRLLNYISAGEGWAGRRGFIPLRHVPTTRRQRSE